MSDMPSRTQTHERHPHAVLDLHSRRFKGMKIERLLDLSSLPQPVRMLEVGTGSGGIAHYFGTHPTIRCEVDAVDVHDNLMIAEGFRFHKVTDTALPFIDEVFDVVLSNHVIEHVGDAEAQHLHLSEIHRVLRPGGIAYLAVPNRWMLTETHFRLKFLSWWPHSWRTPYLRMMGKGDKYDCEPLQMRQLERMLDRAGFYYKNLCIDAWRATYEIERTGSFANHILRAMPDMLLIPFQRIIPRLIYCLTRR